MASRCGSASSRTRSSPRRLRACRGAATRRRPRTERAPRRTPPRGAGRRAPTSARRAPRRERPARAAVAARAGRRRGSRQTRTMALSSSAAHDQQVGLERRRHGGRRRRSPTTTAPCAWASSATSPSPSYREGMSTTERRAYSLGQPVVVDATRHVDPRRRHAARAHLGGEAAGADHDAGHARPLRDHVAHHRDGRRAPPSPAPSGPRRAGGSRRAALRCRSGTSTPGASTSTRSAGTPSARTAAAVDGEMASTIAARRYARPSSGDSSRRAAIRGRCAMR